MKHIKYQIKRRYSNHNIFEDTDNITSDCTSIEFENQGEVNVSLIIDNGIKIMEPGGSVSYNNEPDTMETTVWKAKFDNIAGIKNLLITREYADFIDSENCPL